MNKLWAPWRIEYINQIKNKGCILCNILKEKQDKKNFILFRSNYCFAVLNTYPYNNGHIMIVPNRHIKSLEKLKDNELLDMNKSLIKIKSTLKRTLNPGGFNIGMNIGSIAGAGIDKHLHMHIVPRWQGDTNFMPVLTNTKIISQSLKELYILLKKEIIHHP
ncbi:MAG: HIT domain-containing protein [Candidatus Omnitrophica bacterium]|nr:HIT domain-containing protein [Candidatus Omnitrophota bacterium]MCK5287689.1 HIT domain-containing protein [Candidatus Omnitrophota bacterium]MCK5493338.1 HIT domain-containing protein [Candidatus Omnitrophota bacterium]